MIKKCVVWYMVFAMFFIGIVPHVEASYSPSEAVNASATLRAGDMETIRTVLESKLVSQRLNDLGYTSGEITTRLSSMSDSQIHALAQNLDNMKVGQDGAGVIIALLVIIVAVLVYLQVTGRRILVTK